MKTQIAALIALLTFLPCAFAEGQSELNVAAKVAPAIHTILKNHCYDCHDGDTQEGDVNLYEFSELARDARLQLLNRMEEQVYLSQMPPRRWSNPPPQKESSSSRGSVNASTLGGEIRIQREAP